MKTCSQCGFLKETSDFNKNKSKKDGLNTCCKVCSRENSAKHYILNKESYAKDRDNRRNILSQFVYDYLIENHCIDCGECDPVVLEFDHVTGIKTKNISSMIHDVVSIQNLQLEIDKCVVRCANCHRRKTAKDFSWYKNIAIK